MNYKKDEKYIKAFGENLRTLRKAKGISQETLAFDTELTLSQIGRIERGVINTGISTVFLIAKALNIHPKVLFDFKIPEK